MKKVGATELHLPHSHLLRWELPHYSHEEPGCGRNLHFGKCWWHGGALEAEAVGHEGSQAQERPWQWDAM